MSKKTDQIKKSLEPLFEKAEKEDLWFYSCKVGDFWFSPAELKKNHDRGQYLWGPSNWELRDPEKKLQMLAEKTKEYAIEMNAFYERMQFQRRLNNARACQNTETQKAE